MPPRLRFSTIGACLLGFAATPCAGAAQTDSSSPTAAYACVRLDHDGDRGQDDGETGDSPRIRMVAADERCRGRETRMLVVLSETTPFVADGRPPQPLSDVATGGTIFTAQILDRIFTAPASAPLLVQATLLIDADLGMFGVAPPTVDVNPVANLRGEPSNVRCLPTLDGRPLGAATRLLPRGVTLGLRAGEVFDPTTGQFERPSPGYFPDVLWSQLDESRSAVAGRRAVAIVCQGGLAFQFRGRGSVLVLQPAPQPR